MRWVSRLNVQSSPVKGDSVVHTRRKQTRILQRQLYKISTFESRLKLYILQRTLPHQTVPL
jgi:hypothetical protein